MPDKYADGRSRATRPYQRADGRWMAKVTYRDGYGQLRRIALYGHDEATVVDKVDETRTRLRSGFSASDAGTTVGAIAQQWIDGSLEASDRKPNTKTTYATLARKHVIERQIAGTPVKAVKPSMVERWIVELRRAGLAQSTVRQAYAVLRMILDSAVSDGLLARNPASAIERPKVEVREATFLSPDTARLIVEASQGSRYTPLFRLLLATGMRRGEALALQWSAVNFDKRTISVRGTLARVDGDLVIAPPKSKASRRTLRMNSASMAVLKSLRARIASERDAAGQLWSDTGYVFTTEFGEPCDPRNALRAFSAACKRAGVDDASLHTLRHSAAAAMISEGVPLKAVQLALGHHSITVTGDIYGHVTPEVSDSAMDTLGAAFEASSA